MVAIATNCVELTAGTMLDIGWKTKDLSEKEIDDESHFLKDTTVQIASMLF